MNINDSIKLALKESTENITPNKVVADTWIRHVYGYSETKNYATPQSSDTLKKDVGFEVKAPESLTGGYKLIDTNIAGLVDDSSGKLENKDNKELCAMYTKEGVKKSGFYIALSEYTVLTFNMASGVKPTQQELEDEKNGKLVIVSVSEKKVQEGKAKLPDKTSAIMHELCWSDNRVNYVLSERGYNLGLKELSNIAQDVITQK